MPNNHPPILCCCEGTGYCCITYKERVTCLMAQNGEDCDVVIVDPEVVEITRRLLVSGATRESCDCANVTLNGTTQTCVSTQFFNSLQEAIDGCKDTQRVTQEYACGFCGPIAYGCCVYDTELPAPPCLTPIGECERDPCCDPVFEVCCRTILTVNEAGNECIRRTCVQCNEDQPSNAVDTPVNSCSECDENDYVTLVSPCCPSCICNCCNNPPCDCTNNPDETWLCPDCGSDNIPDPPSCRPCGLYPGCVTYDQFDQPTCTNRKCVGPCDEDEIDPRPLCACGNITVEPGCTSGLTSQNATYNEDFTKGLVTDTTGIRLNSIFLFGYGSHHL